MVKGASTIDAGGDVNISASEQDANSILAGGLAAGGVGVGGPWGS